MKTNNMSCAYDIEYGNKLRFLAFLLKTHTCNERTYHDTRYGSSRLSIVISTVQIETPPNASIFVIAELQMDVENEVVYPLPT